MQDERGQGTEEEGPTSQPVGLAPITRFQGELGPVSPPLPPVPNKDPVPLTVLAFPRPPSHSNHPSQHLLLYLVSVCDMLGRMALLERNGNESFSLLWVIPNFELLLQGVLHFRMPFAATPY